MIEAMGEGVDAELEGFEAGREVSTRSGIATSLGRVRRGR